MPTSPRLNALLQDFRNQQRAVTPRVEVDARGVVITLNQNAAITLLEDVERDLLILRTTCPLPNQSRRHRYLTLLADSLFAADFDLGFALAPDGEALLLQGAFAFAVVTQTGLDPVLAKFAKTQATYAARLREAQVAPHALPEFSPLGTPILGPFLFA